MAKQKVYTCQHRGGCENVDSEVSEWTIDGYDPAPSFFLCADHAAEFGFCVYCGRFIGGLEDVFLTGQTGLCFECFIRVERELQHAMLPDDDSEDDYDYDE